MSQQTRLEVVVPRFLQWMGRFSSPKDLAAASEQEVLAAWAGMGYYSRARNLQKAAQEVADRGWPLDHRGFLALPGVGSYTAAALASLCLGHRVAMVDGNVLRVLSRVHAMGQNPRTGAGKKLLEAKAAAWVSLGDCGEINEATMELGALVCTPRNPACSICPLADSCKACAVGNPESYPARKSKTEAVVVAREVVVLVRDGSVVLRPSRPDELLRGLLVLPQIGELPHFAPPHFCGQVRHAITHHKVLWKVHRTELREARLPEGWVWVAFEELPSRVVSSLVEKSLVLAGVWPRPAVS